MKIFAGFLIAVCCIALFLVTFQIISCVSTSVEYENEVFYAWNLADKSSTLEEKARYIDEFIVNLKEAGHSEYGSIVFKTRDNLWSNNFKALESLRDRLEQIKNIDVKSFEYQIAIQQITAQEQGEAGKMLRVFYNAYVIENNAFVNDLWLIIVQAIGWLCLCVLPFVIWYLFDNY